METPNSKLPDYTDDILVFLKYWKFFEENFLICFLPHPTMVRRSWSEFGTLVALESLLWHSLILFQNQTQQYERHLTNLNCIWICFYRKNVFSELHTFGCHWRWRYSVFCLSSNSKRPRVPKVMWLHGWKPLIVGHHPAKDHGNKNEGSGDVFNLLSDQKNRKLTS